MSGSTSESIFMKVSLSPKCSATFSNSGARSWHGPHHLAYTSTTDGFPSATVRSNSSAVTSATCSRAVRRLAYGPPRPEMRYLRFKPEGGPLRAADGRHKGHRGMQRKTQDEDGSPHDSNTP
eukprot:scaffold3340_cov255-Pinguiococcus_pyrenoidosus.AAC.21